MTRVTIKTFDDAISAHLLRVKLESEDIPCFIRDEHIVTMNPLFNFAVGGIKLQVFEIDEERARRVLEEIGRNPVVDDENQVVTCPNCSSSELYTDFKSMRGIKGKVSVLISLLLVVFPIYFKRVYKCKHCNIEFSR